MSSRIFFKIRKVSVGRTNIFFHTFEMLRLNNQKPEIRAEIRYQYMIIPNSGSVTALPVLFGQAISIHYQIRMVSPDIR